MAPRIPLVPQPLRWLAAGVIAGLICYWSLVTAPPTALPLETTAPPAPTTTASGVVIGTEIPHSYMYHATAYAALTLTLAYALADREISIARKAVLVFALAMGYGALLEVGQSVRPDRVATLADVAVNAVGAAIALGWYGLERRAQFVPVEFDRKRWLSR